MPIAVTAVLSPSQLPTFPGVFDTRSQRKYFPVLHDLSAALRPSAAPQPVSEEAICRNTELLPPSTLLDLQKALTTWQRLCAYRLLVAKQIMGSQRAIVWPGHFLLISRLLYCE
ncbi:hypothetical protein MBM_07715 [Drepanopeziza brunnea f. sp. 'multigermtubi' MB_m1]|uniref:Uncharacterized protein n=1 Tax=Marssonina brunnea f. sp. multigermtubi (strain MB_m1) TaxID=1072389 RepID=K1WZH3_MARBU|nr:uncharacterized protein MBM_07715 [Drepanopeziza brunnea f. sp. 'multigermtubi' MB_m1]EKD14038.1 hypothetical protein MBM_07715 [Drepanopeziza brunnea f. sp. 'multigermtubi' MB_m1]